MADAQETGQITSDSEVLGEGGKKALQAEREARAAAEKRLHEMETAFQSQQDEYAETVKALEEKVNAATAVASSISLERDRVQVAYESGLPADLVDFLKGDSVEALRESAETLLKHVNSARESRFEMRPDPSQGAHGGDVPASTAEQFAIAFEQALR